MTLGMESGELGFPDATTHGRDGLRPAHSIAGHQPRLGAEPVRHADETGGAIGAAGDRHHRKLIDRIRDPHAETDQPSLPNHHLQVDHRSTLITDGPHHASAKKLRLDDPVRDEFMSRLDRVELPEMGHCLGRPCLEERQLDEDRERMDAVQRIIVRMPRMDRELRLRDARVSQRISAVDARLDRGKVIEVDRSRLVVADGACDLDRLRLQFHCAPPLA